jgi:signal transduction histidine kinase
VRIMNITKSLEEGIEKFYAKIWNDEKISSRPLWAVIVIPLVLSTLSVWLKLTFLNSALPPFLSFFVVVMFCICYSGIRGALIAVAITMIFSIALVIAAKGKLGEYASLSAFPVLFYFIETIFFIALMHRAQVTEKRCRLQYDNLLKIKNEIQERENRHEDFVHMATHELKTPVTVLKAYLQLASMKMQIPPSDLAIHELATIEEFRQLIEKMDIQLEKLVNLINDLSESSRVKSGALNYQMKPFDVVECVNNCVDGFKAAYTEASIDCTLNNFKLLVNGDNARVEQVILNLLSNAVKYTSGIPKIHISCTQEGEKVYVRVKDQGLGIPTNIQPAIFDRFFRVDSPEVKRSPGLGLGLYICADIIKSHDGEIGVHSVLNEGSTFWFSLPLLR